MRNLIAKIQQNLDTALALVYVICFYIKRRDKVEDPSVILYLGYGVVGSRTYTGPMRGLEFLHLLVDFGQAENYLLSLFGLQGSGMYFRSSHMRSRSSKSRFENT